MNGVFFMMRSLSRLLTLTALMGLATAASAANWVAGKHYSVIPQAQRTNSSASCESGLPNSKSR